MTRTTLRRAPVMLAVLLVALTGCSGDPEPQIAEPSPTASETDSSPDPADAAPQPPTEAMNSTRAGAIAFAAYYWDLVTFAQTTGRTEDLEAAGSPSCDSCSAGLAWIDDVYERGGRVTGGDYSTSSVTADPLDVTGPTAFSVDLILSSTDQRVTGAGSLNQDFPARDAQASMVVTFDGRWKVARWDVE